ncbi:MAG: sensor histidine kinase [bacterium]
MERIVWFSEFLFMSILTFLPTIFLLHRCDEIAKKSNLFRAVMALWGIYLVLLIISQFTEIFYYVTPENMCERGPLFALLLVPLLAIMLFNIGGVLRRKEKLSKSAYIALLVDLLPMAIAIFLHMFIFASVFIVFGMTVSAMTMFVLIFRNNMAEYMRQQREIASQRAGVMVLQMRPHFIYNTMMGIYYLCDLDSQKAKQVTLDFTTYLRKNFTAIASEDTIPFHDELEHTRAYLAVEQAQYDDSLHVNFDTPHTLFRIPPLTLQPIVENAVKHGMKSSIDPIRILVVTRKTETASELIVEDNGPGFDPNVDDNDEPHIALNNIRHRLELMCNGTLEISPREGGGTSVKVTIPAAER